MRFQIRDISLFTALKVGCCFHTVLASVPAFVVTILAIQAHETLVDRSPIGVMVAGAYVSIIAWLAASILLGGVAWLAFALIYNMIASFVGGVEIEMERIRPPVPVQQPAPPPQDMHPEYPDPLPPTAFEVDDQGAIRTAVHSGDHVPYDKPAIPYEKPVITAKQQTHYWEGRWKHK